METLMILAFFFLIADIYATGRENKPIAGNSTPLILIGILILAGLEFTSSMRDAIPKGIHKLQADVTSYHQGDEIQDNRVFVDFDITYESEEGVGEFLFEPQTIYWPDGSYTILEEAEYAEMGYDAYCEYGSYSFELRIPDQRELKFSKTEQFFALSTLYKILWMIPVCMTIYDGVLFFRADKKKRDDLNEYASYEYMKKPVTAPDDVFQEQPTKSVPQNSDRIEDKIDSLD